MGPGEDTGRQQEQAGSVETSASHQEPAQPAQTPEEALEERRKIRRLQLIMDMVMSVIAQDDSLSYEEAAEMIADSKRAALAMFPEKELAYNLIYKPRLQRLMRERFRIQ
jgi:hypothetical protein